MPTGKSLGLGDIVAATAVLGAGFVRMPGGMRPEQAARHYAAQFSRYTAQQLDGFAPRLATEQGGIIWAPGQTWLREERPLGIGLRLFFEVAGVRIHLGDAKRALVEPAMLRLRALFWAPRA